MSTHAHQLPVEFPLAFFEEVVGEGLSLHVYKIHYTSAAGINYHNGNQYSIRTLSKKTEIAGFSLVDMPGCCGVIISTGTVVNGAWQKRGIAKELQDIKKNLCKAAGYSLMLSTCVDWTINKTLLDKTGWTTSNLFKNKRTSHSVALLTKEVV